jgi:hypothetical protein
VSRGTLLNFSHQTTVLLLYSLLFRVYEYKNGSVIMLQRQYSFKTPECLWKLHVLTGVECFISVPVFLSVAAFNYCLKECAKPLYQVSWFHIFGNVNVVEFGLILFIPVACPVLGTPIRTFYRIRSHSFHRRFRIGIRLWQVICTYFKLVLSVFKTSCTFLSNSVFSTCNRFIWGKNVPTDDEQIGWYIFRNWTQFWWPVHPWRSDPGAESGPRRTKSASTAQEKLYRQINSTPWPQLTS